MVDRVTSVGETAHGGTVEITVDGQGVRYSAPADFEGTDTFEYTADGKHRATVEVHVTRPVRDDYIGSGVYEDTVGNVLDVLQNDFKGNGYQGPQIITSVSETSEEGTVTIVADGRSLVYTPPAGYRGTDTFSYTVDGDLVAEAEVRVRSITTGDSYSLYPNPAEPQHTLYVLSNDHFGSNYPGPGLITAVGETGNGGLVTISEDGSSLRFVPAEGGSDGFTYTVDGKYEATVSVSFKNFLRADSFAVDQNSQENELDPLENDFRSSASNGYLGPRKITSVGPSEHGATVTIAADGKKVVYWPAPDFIGTDRLTYTVDGLMQRTIRVNVIRRVRDDVFRVEPDSRENALPVLVNDLFGADYFGAGRVTAVTETGAGGTATVSEDGKSIVYTPAAGFTGEDKFTYTVDDALKAEVTVWAAASVEEILPQFESQADFEQFLLDDALARYEHLFGVQVGPLYPEYPYDNWYLGGDAVSPGADSSRSHSETNVQVAGVDEADIIETDGDYLYVLTGAELIIAEAWPAEELSIASRVPIEGELVGEYLHGDRLTVISETWEDPWCDPPEPLGFQLDVIDCWWPWPRSSETWVTVFDVSDRESRIDDSVFLVLRDDEVDRWLPEPERIQVGDSFFYETREQYIERVTAEMDSFLPQYTSYGADDELLEAGLLHASGDLFQPLGEDAGCLVTVVSLNISDDEPGIVASTGIFTTGASQIYGSLDNLYVFDQQYTWEDGTVTEILKFDWDAQASGVAFAAKGWVPGHMLDQFSADEHEGHLRIATTISNSYSGNWSGRSENVLFVLRDDGGVLEFVGSMQNLALEERIRSVRFMGERAFVTTFRNIDPLFALDLSDPAHPQSCGHVTMPGFNSYMQLINESYLLAVGRNTPVGNTGPTQVSLFDIQDLNQPRLIDQHTFERFSTSEAETDHHAFGWFAEHKVLAMPSARAYWERVDEDGDGYAETRRSVREDELLLFSIDVTATRLSGDGIQLLGELAHDSPVRRSAFIADVLYSVAESSVQAVSIVDPTVRFAEIGFDSGQETPGAGGEEATQIRIIDDEDAGFRRDGNWGYHPDQGFADGMHYRRAGSGEDVASWTFWVEPGRYHVAATWPEYVNRASNAPFTVLDGSTPLATVRLDQDSAPDDFMEGQIGWESLGVFDVTGNCLVVTLSDDADEYVIADAVLIQPVPTIAGRHVFYNNATIDGNHPAPNDQDDLAIADDKHPLLPGQTATFANYTTYSRGINGVMVDIAGLAGTLTPEDFEFKVGNDNDPNGWELLTVAPSIGLRPGEGKNRSDRVTLTWEDNAIPTGNWLQVRVKATENTGLDQDEVFYFGNVIGDTDGDRVAACADMYAIYQQLGQPATVESPLDIDRDGVITQADMDAVFSEAGRLSVLNLITVPSVVATDDAATTEEDTIINIAVLGNDRDADGDPLSVAAADDTSALGASVTINLDGTLTYDPRDSATLQALASGETMEDTFSYTISDVRGGTDTGTVTVTLSGLDEPEGGEIIEAVGVDPLADGPGPLAKNFDIGGEDAAGMTRESAHDAVMKGAAEPQGPERSLVRWDWLWWYDYEQMRLKKRSSKKDSLAQQAADELLAAWQA
ncbi:MAG: beta-propeller domain-containing protein [Planctomycetota bacterium]